METEIKKWSLDGLNTTDALVSSVYDGDTLRLVLPVCCTKYIFSCRLNGIDTPEIRSRNKQEKVIARQVRDYVKELLESHAFRVCCGKSDKYGRILCDIYVILDGVELSLADHLIGKKYGYIYNGGKKLKFEDWYKEK